MITNSESLEPALCSKMDHTAMLPKVVKLVEPAGPRPQLTAKQADHRHSKISRRKRIADSQPDVIPPGIVDAQR